MSRRLAEAVNKLLPKDLPPSLSSKRGNLYEVLARYPKDGVGQRVYQLRWGEKGIEGSYWKVTRAMLKMNGTHGKAWGRLTWRGQVVSTQDERIPGGLKYMWKDGVSTKPLPEDEQL